jgi:hypothetical protein
MRIALALLVGCLLVPLASPAAGARDPVPGHRAVFDVGDSLALGTRPYLRTVLRGYELRHVHDIGLHAYDVPSVLRGERRRLPGVIVVSGGTNDDPRGVSTFHRAVLDVLAIAGPGRCVVWPTIVRPPAVGASYDRLNRTLSILAARHRSLVVVDWVGLVARHRAWLAADGVHTSAAGYRARAQAIAKAVRARCSR